MWCIDFFFKSEYQSLCTFQSNASMKLVHFYQRNDDLPWMAKQVRISLACKISGGFEKGKKRKKHGCSNIR